MKTCSKLRSVVEIDFNLHDRHGIDIRLHRSTRRGGEAEPYERSAATVSKLCGGISVDGSASGMPIEYQRPA